MKAKAVLSRAKGDWMGFCEQMGYPTWQSVGKPCPCCNAFGVQLQLPCSCKLDNLPFRENEEIDYHNACLRCEVEHPISRQLHRKIGPLLYYCKKAGTDGVHGRALKDDIPGTPLRKDYRLEPCKNLEDVGDFEMLQHFPVVLTFWCREGKRYACGGILCLTGRTEADSWGLGTLRL